MNSHSTLATLDAFKKQLVAEFIPSDDTRRGKEKLRNLKQETSVEKYLSEFRNAILMIGEMHEGEKIDRFVDGLKYHVRVEVLKSNFPSFEECACMVLNVDSAMWRALKGNPGHFSNNYGSQPTHMEIGNVSSSKSQVTRSQQE